MACTQKVKVSYDKKRHPIDWELLCSGDCADKTACKPKVDVTDAKTGSTREYCACKNGTAAEPADCHIVLYKVRKRPKGKVEDTYFQCEETKANACPAGKKCIPVPVGNGLDKDGDLQWMEFECMCQPEDEAWPES